MPEPSRRTDAINVVRVEFSPIEDARRLVLGALEGLPEGRRARLASVIAARLRDAGLLGQSVEQHYSAQDAGALMGKRSSAWAVKHARAGDFGPVSCDGGDWLIPASGLNRYLARCVCGKSSPVKNAALTGEIASERVFQSAGRTAAAAGRANLSSV